MEQDHNPEPGADRPAADKAAVGRQLRERREYLGMSVEDVSAKIKLAPRQIVAMEADDFKALPETAFLRGFVRSYAKLLQMDDQALLAALPGAQPVKLELPQVESPFPTEKTARRQNVNLLLAALAIAIVIGGFLVWQSRAPKPDAAAQAVAKDSALVATPLPLPEQTETVSGPAVTSESAVLAEPAVQPEAAVSSGTIVPAAAVASAVKPAGVAPAAALRFTFDKESWAEIRDNTGVILSRQVNPAGSELRIEGVPPFAMVIGHAGGVHLYYREKPVDLSGYIKAGSDVARMTLE